MKTTANISNTVINRRLIALVVLMLLSSIGMFGQEVIGTSADVDFKMEVAYEGDDSNSQMELVMWIMGSKTQMNVDNENRISTNGSGKKKYINCGMTPNRILSKTFLKKAMNRDQATA